MERPTSWIDFPPAFSFPNMPAWNKNFNQPLTWAMIKAGFPAPMSWAFDKMHGHVHASCLPLSTLASFLSHFWTYSLFHPLLHRVCCITLLDKISATPIIHEKVVPLFYQGFPKADVSKICVLMTKPTTLLSWYCVPSPFTMPLFLHSTPQACHPLQ